MRIDDNDPTPRYAQIADDLRRSVARGDLAAGQRLPSARNLAKQYEVSLVTTQKALDLLKSEGVLVGYATRGTFVAADPKTAQGQGGSNAGQHSPEYETIMGELDQIQNEFRQRTGELDQRLSQLEDDVRRSDPPSPQGH